MSDERKRVAVVTPDGKFGTIDAQYADEVERSGGRILSKQEQAEQEVEQRYEALPTGRKVLGAASAATGLLNPLLAGSSPDAPPEFSAFGEGVREGATGGLFEAGQRKLADAVGGKAAGDKYAAELDQTREASPIASILGQTTGFVGGTALGAGGGAPGVIGGAGALLEHSVERGLARAGLQGAGAFGRAATTAAAMGARGALEGGAIGALGQFSDNVVHDAPEVGDKLYAAFGHGALTGGALGGALGFGGSLAASGVRGILGKLMAASNAAGGAAETGIMALRQGAQEAQENAAGALRRGGRGVRLRPDVEGAPEPAGYYDENPIDWFGKQAVDTDAGRLQTFKRTEDVPLGEVPHEPVWSQGKLDALRQNTGKEVPPIHLGVGEDGKYVMVDGIHRTARARELGQTKIRATIDDTVPPTADPFEVGPEAAGGGILAKAAEIAEAGTKPDVLRGIAHDQAFRAAGGGFGLQTTRFAKEAAKYFGGPEGTKNLGKIALKHGIIDVGEASASPFQAAWNAAKGGRPADMLPRASAALDSVGKQIGDITTASNARVPVTEISDAFGRVRAEPASKAFHENVVKAIDDAHMSMLRHLPIAPDGTVAVQDLLKQRKALEEIVFKETKTLDPNQRVGALREVRTELEGLVTKALDDASGEVPGQLREKYQALKKDYHGLRILNDVLEDSAARASKHATLGLGEKFALGMSLASGHFLGGPVLAVGGKLLKERGNAAAAAFLSRAADQGTFAKVLRDFDTKVQRAAHGAIRDTPSNSGTRRTPKRATAGGGAPDDAVAGREAVKKTQATAGDIVQWIGKTKADPTQLQHELDEASAIVSRSVGPKAAQSYSTTTLRAINFIASYIPVKERRDPLDPKSTPPLTHDEAARLVRAATYATKPETVWNDFERGKVTPEGIAAAKTFMPDAFAEFQGHLEDVIQGHMLRNERLSDSQRLRISKLLGYAAGPSFKPAALSRLQANFTQSPQGSPAGPPTPQVPPNRPVNMKVQQSGFDAVEARFTS